MRISEYFHLGLDQSKLDFLDVDTSKDIKLFIDPSWIHILKDDWCVKASETLFGFFDHVIELYEKGEVQKARELFDHSHEPNETCLGMSSNNPEGTGASPEMLSKVFDTILSLQMIENGLIKRLEDMHVFVENFGPDRLSDLVTNVIRKHLIDFTIQMCSKYNIPLDHEIQSLGHYWDNKHKKWAECYEKPLLVSGKKILLVPKKIVVKNYRYTAGQYCTHHVLARRVNQHLSEDTSLVRRRQTKKGKIIRKVFKKEIRIKEIKEANLSEKQYIREVSKRNPDLIDEFRSSIATRLIAPGTTNKLSDEQLTAIIKES